MKKPRLRGVRILHEDLDVIVVEKAAGILSQALRQCAAPSVEGELTDYLRKGQWKSTKRAYLVHRLDRETSGVMMVAKNEQAQTWLRDHWNEVTEKVYLARVEGALPADAGVYESYLREDENFFVKSVKNPQYGKLARTEWKTFPLPGDLKGRPAQDGCLSPGGRNDRPAPDEPRGRRLEQANPSDLPGSETPRGRRLEQANPSDLPGRETSLVEVALKSGRKNQIRVHFSENGHPVVGDAKYGRGQRGDALCLHAWKLAFRHPHTGERMSFETELPAFAFGPPAPARTPEAGAQPYRKGPRGGKHGRDRRPGGPRNGRL